MWRWGSALQPLRCTRPAAACEPAPEPPPKLPAPLRLYRLQMGVTSLHSFHVHMRLNGAYWGQYAYTEQPDQDTLKVGARVAAQAAPARRPPPAHGAPAALLPTPPTPQRWGYDVAPKPGPLWKSTSGEYSNLRWDIRPEHIPFYWKQVRRVPGAGVVLGGACACACGGGRWPACSSPA